MASTTFEASSKFLALTAGKIPIHDPNIVSSQPTHTRFDATTHRGTNSRQIHKRRFSRWTTLRASFQVTRATAAPVGWRRVLVMADTWRSEII